MSSMKLPHDKDSQALTAYRMSQSMIRRSVLLGHVGDTFCVFTLKCLHVRAAAH